MHPLIDLLKQPGKYLHAQSSNSNTRTRCEICSELRKKTPEWRHWHCSGVFIHNFEHTSHLVPVFLLSTLNRQIPIKNFHVLAHFEFPKYSLCILSKIVTISFRIPILNQCFRSYIWKYFIIFYSLCFTLTE